MRRIFISTLLLAFACTALSQSESSKTKNKNIYFSWGYTRAAYSKSDLHFQDLSGTYHPETGRYNYYDFTVYGAKAKDRPDFDKIKDIVNVTVPQFVFRIGYYFKNNVGIELNYDHTKYVVVDNQKARVKGQFNGRYYDGDTLLDPASFLHFEHSDGANFWMLNLVRNFELLNVKEKLKVGIVVKPGAGVVIPRTDVTLFGERLNNDWHLAGWIAGVESGIHVDFLKNGIFELVGKGVYADYVNSLVIGKGNGKASHHFFAAQITATLGWKINLKD